jgi:hypothetical protein
MDTSSEQDNGRFPPGYEHVEEEVRAAAERIKHLEGQIEKMRATKDGPVPELRPFGGPPRRSKDQTIAAMQRWQAEERVKAMKLVEKATEQDKITGPEVRDRALRELYDNPFRRMTREELDQRRAEEKGLDKAQDFADAHHPADPRRPRRMPERSAPEPSTGDDRRWSRSARFNQPLESPIPEHPVRGKDKDGPER